MRKIVLFISVLIVLNSCNSQKFIGEYYYNQSIDSDSTNLDGIQKKLKLIDSRNFEYSVTRQYRDGPRGQLFHLEITEDKGLGTYKIRNDSIYLNFQKEGFDYNDYKNQFLSISPRVSTKKKAFIKINFGSLSNVRVLLNNEKISESDFYGNAAFEITNEKFPANLEIDFSNCPNKLFENYILQLTERKDYYINFRIPNIVGFQEDIVLPIAKKNEAIRIGKLKSVL